MRRGPGSAGDPRGEVVGWHGHDATGVDGDTDAGATHCARRWSRGCSAGQQPVVGLLDVTGIRESAAALRAAFAAVPASAVVLHAFAVKAAALVPVLRLLARGGLGAEVASPGELALARAAGIPADRIVLDSPAKTPAELREALALGIAVNADNPQELDRIDALRGRRARPRPRSACGSIRRSAAGSIGAHEHGDRHLEVRRRAARRRAPGVGRARVRRPPLADPAAHPHRLAGRAAVD